MALGITWYPRTYKGLKRLKAMSKEKVAIIMVGTLKVVKKKAF